ncbi:hypothetical protein lerEdw1_011397 [Lerista edwardsae]|nr:hypothetical protein lerEdw1_011397 [Lerista edwardsae]
MAARSPQDSGDRGAVLEGTGTANHIALVKNEERPVCEEASWGKEVPKTAEAPQLESESPQFVDPPCWDDIFLSSVERAANAQPGKWLSQLIPSLKEEARLEDREEPGLLEEAGVNNPKEDGALLDADESSLCLEIKQESVVGDSSLANASVSENCEVSLEAEKSKDQEISRSSEGSIEEMFPLACKQGGVSECQQSPEKPQQKPPRKRLRKSIQLKLQPSEEAHLWLSCFHVKTTLEDKKWLSQR